MSTDLRQQLGRIGEEIACRHLERRGLRVVDRNYRTRWGELDIVACSERWIVFCEVKSRRGARAAPLLAVDARKRLQVRRMASAWLAERAGRPYAPELRFDAIGVTVDAHGELLALDHLEGAF